jgi:hypothetical protein
MFFCIESEVFHRNTSKSVILPNIANFEKINSYLGQITENGFTVICLANFTNHLGKS